MNKARENKANPTKSRESSYTRLKKIKDEKGRVGLKKAMEIFWETYGEEMDKMGK